MNAKKPRTPCPVCGMEPYRSYYTYCSNACQKEYQYQTHISEWKSGERIGLQRQGIVTTYVKRYLREKYADACCMCGWSKVNPVTGRVPLIADHIDGNWRNNVEANLRLLCPNCDALNPTYAALNRGKGRGNRGIDRRAVEARAMIPLSRKAK